MIVDEGCFERGCACHDSRESPGVVVVKREWRSLSDEESKDLWISAVKERRGPRWFAIAIETALRSKNHE
jgi:hypothetical protein